MKRLVLAAAVVLALVIYACNDVPLRPKPNSPPTLSGDNPPGPYAVNSQRPDLVKLLKKKVRPSFNISGSAGGSDIGALAATLSPGQTNSENIVVNLPSAPPKGDVLFSFDLTGSMDPALSALRTNATNIMNAINGVIPDAQFGLITHKDYASPTVASGQTNCADASYGSGTDYPYH